LKIPRFAFKPYFLFRYSIYLNTVLTIQQKDWPDLRPNNEMTDDINSYEVKCRTCRTTFKVQLFDSHEKNLFVADKKDWHCDKCKKEYFKKQTAELSNAHKSIGFQELQGSEKMISWAEKIRGEMANKVNYLRGSLTFKDENERVLSDKAFEKFFAQWHNETDAKWWIDNRRMNVRDISNQVAAISEELKKA